MNKTYFGMTTILVTCVPYVGASAATITCTEGGVRLDTHTCTIVGIYSDITLGDSDEVKCLCPDGTGVYDVFCNAKNEPYDDDSNGVIDDYAYFEIGSCYIPTCAAGEYFNTNNGLCESCAYFTNCDKENVTSDAGSVGVNECYFPKGVEQSDDSGTFVFTNNCYWDGERQMSCNDGEEESTTTTAT
ncbi:MAG: hypothetical protein J6L70_02355 [Alphaproteobacteria bacterium]|nr:hypothetical protein [Alphaproteobacteria bacterium]